MKIQVKILIGLSILGQLTVGATYLLAFVNAGLAGAFACVMAISIIVAAVGTCHNWKRIGEWDAERKAKKEPQTPPKGDWKG